MIFAINIQKDPNPEGIDQKVIEILTKAIDLGCLIIHSCSRRKLGLAFNGKMGPKISIISIIDYQSYEENFLELKAIVQEKRNEYLININKS